MTISYRNGLDSDAPAATGGPHSRETPHTGPMPPAPRREVIPPHPQTSIRTLTHDFPSEICGWGSHPEYEIHLITKSHGSFIAGDHIGQP